MRSAWLNGRTALATLALVAGCAPPPVLTPLRIADRGLAPLERTADLRFGLSAYFEQQRRSPDDDGAQLRFELHDVALRPNLFFAFGITDSLAYVLPAGFVWSPVVEPACGQWLTLGGGVYGLGLGADGATLTNVLGVWAKRRFGADIWTTVGVAALHVYDSRWQDREGETRSWNELALIPGGEAGVQLADRWALTLVADYRLQLREERTPYGRLRAEVVFTPEWGFDVGLHAGTYLHAREPLHLDPLIGMSLAGRW